VKPLLCILLVFLSSADCVAQRVRTSFGDHAQIFGNDWGSVLSAPGSFDGNDWLLLGSALGATAAAWAVDEDVREWSQQQRTPDMDAWLRAGDHYGAGKISIALGVLMYSGGEVFDDDWSRTTGRMVLQSLAYSEFITLMLKAVLGRSRPFTDRGSMEFDMFTLSHETTSFPSGHTTAAFAVSTTLSRRIAHPAATTLLFSLAGLTMLQRMFSDNHWLSDTVMGAAIGSATAWAVTELERKRESEQILTPPGTDEFAPHRSLVGIRVEL